MLYILSAVKRRENRGQYTLQTLTLGRRELCRQ